jgi:hypothetical protein
MRRVRVTKEKLYLKRKRKEKYQEPQKAKKAEKHGETER